MAEMEYLEALKQKHKELSDRVEQAEKSPSPDHIQIAEMKKQKLHLKEKIFGMSKPKTSFKSIWRLDKGRSAYLKPAYRLAT